MKKFAKILLILFGMLFVVFIVLIATYESVVIDRYDAEITVNASGDMTVVERWDIDYKEFMSVRFRDIKFNKYADGYPLPILASNTAAFDETNVSLRVYKNDVDVTSQVRIGYSFLGERDELGYLITCEPFSPDCESLFVDVSAAGGLEGKVSFEYVYTILGAITKYSDISELNWRMFEYMEGTIKESLVTVTFPTHSRPIDEVLVWGHGLSKGTIHAVETNKVEMKLSNVKKGEFLEFRILMPNESFPTIPAKNIFIDPDINKQVIVDYENQLASETNFRIFLAQAVLGLSIAMVASMIFIAYKVYLKYDKEYIAEFQEMYFRDLPSKHTPAEMSYLYYFRKTNDEDVTATLLDLVRRKIVTILYEGTNVTSRKADFELRLTDPTKLKELLPHERHIVNWFFGLIGNGTSVSTSQIENYGKLGITHAERFQKEGKEFVKHVKKTCEHYDFFEKNLDAAKKKVMVYFLIPVLMLILAAFTGSIFALDNTISIVLSIVTALSYAVYIGSIKKRSVKGNELFAKWKAFRSFLLDFGNIKDYPMPGVVVWEHYLVYATSFKIADKVMSQLKVKLPIHEYSDPNATYMGIGYNMRGFYFGHAFFRINRSFATAKTNAIQTIAVHNAQKASSGGGGGFGGGSSFGGGGGGGRSR